MRMSRIVFPQHVNKGVINYLYKPIYLWMKGNVHIQVSVHHPHKEAQNDQGNDYTYPMLSK